MKNLLDLQLVKNFLKNNFECTVGAKVVETADGLKVIVSLVQRFASTVCVRCQVGSKASSGVCEEVF